MKKKRIPSDFYPDILSAATLLLLLLVVLPLLFTTARADDGFTFNGGLHYGRGDDVRVQEWSQLSVSAGWRPQGQTLKNWRFKAGSGWLRYGDGEQGISDSWATATYLIQRPWLNHWWDIRARLKLPTADAKRSLGTGSIDQDLRLQALKSFDNSLLWYYAGYRQRGKSDEYDLNNSWLWGAGIKLDRYSVFYDGWQASQPGRDTGHSVGVSGSYQWAQKTWSPYLSAEQDGDWSLGITLSF